MSEVGAGEWSDGEYPTEAALARIRAWSWKDPRGLMDFVRSVWWCADWGWHETQDGDATICAISTGGWSGNEDLIGALEANRDFWMLYWLSTRRGGHYEFRLRPFAETATKPA